MERRRTWKGLQIQAMRIGRREGGVGTDQRRFPMFTPSLRNEEGGGAQGGFTHS